MSAAAAAASSTYIWSLWYKIPASPQPFFYGVFASEVLVDAWIKANPLSGNNDAVLHNESFKTFEYTTSHYIKRREKVNHSVSGTVINQQPYITDGICVNADEAMVAAKKKAAEKEHATFKRKCIQEDTQFIPKPKKQNTKH
jgi:hypothetical protein